MCTHMGCHSSSAGRAQCAAAQDTSSTCGPLLHVSPVTYMGMHPMRTVTSRFCCTCIQNMITGISDMKSLTMHGTKKTSELISTESLFSSDTSHHPSMKLVLCERRPTASPVSRHVLVRPGIFCLWLRAVLQFPPPTRKPKAASRHSNMDHSEQRALLPARRNAR